MMRRIATVIAGSAAAVAMMTGFAVQATATTGPMAAPGAVEREGVRITGHPDSASASSIFGSGDSIFSTVDGSARDQ